MLHSFIECDLCGRKDDSSQQWGWCLNIEVSTKIGDEWFPIDPKSVKRIDICNSCTVILKSEFRARSFAKTFGKND